MAEDMDIRKLPNLAGEMQRRMVTVERDLLATRAEGDDRIPVSIASEYPVERRFGYEVLVHTREAVDMEHAAGGLPFLDSHDATRQMGIVEDVHIGADKRLRGMLRKGNHPDAEWMFRDIEAGVRPNLSAGYVILDAERDADDADTVRVTRWKPMEVSTVSVPADITVGVGRSAEADVTRLESVVERAEKLRAFVEHMTTAKDAGPRAAEPLAADAAPAGTTEAPVETRATTHKEHDMSEDIAPAHKPGPGAISLEEKQKEMADVARLAREHGMEEHLASWFERGLSKDQVSTEILARKRETAAKPVDVPGYLGMSEREGLKFNFNRAITAIANKQWDEKGGFEKEVSDAIAKRNNRTTGGMFIPLDLPVMTRTSATGNIAGTSSLGGAGVQTSILSLIDLLRNKMLVRQLGATVLSGLTGNISFPRHIVANTMAWEGENPSTAHADTAATFDNVTLSPKTAMASSAYSRQLLIQQSFDASAFVQNDLATVLALGLDLAALDGTGANNQPTGIMRQSGVTTIVHTGTAAGGIPTFPEMVGYETQVATNNADIGNISWVTTPGMRGKLKTVLKSTTAGSAYIWESDNTVNGYPAYATSQMPSNYTYGTSTTVAHGIVFGVWSELLLGEWGGALEVIVDPYTLAKQNMITVTQMILADVAVRHPKAFAITKSALIA